MYTPLYIKTHNSLLESLIKIDELIKYANENNIKSLALTDNTMYGVMDFYYICLKNNINPIIGLEIKVNDSIIILYCKNYEGYLNIIKLCTLKETEKITILTLKNYASNLICIVPFNSQAL